MNVYKYSAGQIEALTSGRVNLKTLNNWATKGQWFSEIAPGQSGRPRFYSRLNVIEAYIAAELTMIGLSRSRIKDVLTLIAARGKAAGWSGLLPEELEQSAAFKKGSKGWHLIIGSRPDNTVRAASYEAVQDDDLGQYLRELYASGEVSSVVGIDLSGIVERVDQLPLESAD